MGENSITTISVGDIANSLNDITTTISTSELGIGSLKHDGSYYNGYLATYITNIELNPDSMKKYGLEEDKKITLKDIKGWSFFGESDSISGLSSNDSFCLRTNVEKGWLCEFKIFISIQGNKMLYFVSPECLDYYFIEENELLEALKESIKVDTQTFKWTEDSTGGIYTTMPNTWSSTITCDSATTATYASTAGTLVYNPDKCYVTATSIC